MSRQLQREMTISHRDFYRLLPQALQGMEHTRNGNRIAAESGRKKIRIELSSESRKQIGALSLPVTNLSLAADGFSGEEWRQFIGRFELAYQRGGG